MRFRVLATTHMQVTSVSVNIDNGDGSFSSFPALVGNPNYDAFLESQGLTDEDVQAMEPDEWHDSL